MIPAYGKRAAAEWLAWRRRVALEAANPALRRIRIEEAAERRRHGPVKRFAAERAAVVRAMLERDLSHG